MLENVFVLHSLTEYPIFSTVTHSTHPEEEHSTKEGKSIQGFGLTNWPQRSNPFGTEKGLTGKEKKMSC